MSGMPAIINYLLALRQPGGDKLRTNWVCFYNVAQLIIPMVPPGLTINYTGRPLPGTYGFLQFDVRWGMDVVPNAFSGGVTQYGSVPIAITLTQQALFHGTQLFLMITDQEPDYEVLTNNSPLGQRWEVFIQFLIIPGAREMELIYDALRRLHTSAKSEELQNQANDLLRAIAGPRVAPQPPEGGG